MSTFVFDLDGTLADTKELTILAYQEASGGTYDTSFWGRSAEEWGCTPEIHAEKTRLFRQGVASVKTSWAYDFAMRLVAEDIPYSIATSASDETVEAMDLNPKLKAVLAGAKSGIFTSMSWEQKRVAISAVPGRVHYFDDNVVIAEKITRGLRNVVLHCPELLPRAVVLAAGEGSRFNGVDKALIALPGTTVIDRLLGQACSFRPVVVSASTRGVRPRAESTVFVRSVQNGPAASAMLAGGEIPAGSPVVFVDCDVVLPDGWLDIAAEGALNSGACVLVAEHTDEPGKYGRVTYKDGLLKRVVEGSTTRGPVLVGVYAFASMAYFQDLFAECWTTVREVKMATLALKADHCEVAVVEWWVPLGSPEEVTFATERGLL